MPLMLAFSLVTSFIWLAENVAIWAGAWFYPSQADGWHPTLPLPDEASRSAVEPGRRR